MKIGFLGPIGGIIAAAIIIALFTFNTVTDSPWRWLGFVLGVVAFLAGIYFGYGNQPNGNQPNSNPPQ